MRAGRVPESADKSRAGLTEKYNPKVTVINRVGKSAKRGGGLAEAVDAAISNIQSRLGKDDMKGSVADLVRLLQLRKELNDTQPQKVTVGWVDEWQPTFANDR
jgi:hypothetical protein